MATMLRLERQGPLAVLTLDRPPANALNRDFFSEVGTVLPALAAADVRDPELDPRRPPLRVGPLLHRVALRIAARPAGAGQVQQRGDRVRARLARRRGGRRGGRWRRCDACAGEKGEREQARS